MKQFNLTTILIVIILGLLIYLALKPSGDGKYLDIIKQQNEEIEKSKKELAKLITVRFDSLKLFERKETIIKNYYNEIISSVDTITNDSGAIATIRLQLHKLGSARLN